MDMLFSNYLHTLTGNLFVRLVLWCVVLDTALGCLRAVKYRKWNSSVGIDGGIRKVAMVLSVLFLVLVDDMVGVDVLAWQTPIQGRCLRQWLKAWALQNSSALCMYSMKLPAL